MNVKQIYLSISFWVLFVCVSFAECDFFDLDSKAMVQYRNSESLQEILHALEIARDCFEEKGLHLGFWGELPINYAHASFLLYMRNLNVALHAEDHGLAKDVLVRVIEGYQFSVNGLDLNEKAILVVHRWRLMDGHFESPGWESSKIDSWLLSFTENL